MMIEGKNLDFATAHDRGLITRVLDGDDFAAEVHAFARFCPPNKASRAVGLIKRSVQTGAELPLEVGWALERELQARLFSSEDAKAGLQAYLDKAKPTLQGG
jgi:enoyl-CoA hydratase/carnithine racemase